LEGAKKSSCDSDGTPLWMIGTLRAVLTSSSARPGLDLQLIADKEAESPTFRSMLPRVCEVFGGRFLVVTGDAGLTSRENAALVREHQKHYLFWLKGNQPTLHAIAQGALWGLPACAKTVEHANGKTVTRELFALNIASQPDVDMADAQQVWCVRQTTQPISGEATGELRCFITSLPERALTPGQKLGLVRLHWGIENGHNWTMDVILGEDDSQPCQHSKDAIEVVAWLRLLAYNLLSLSRSKARKKDRRPMNWKRVMEKLRDALVMYSCREVQLASLE
jgi:predicted transposase YbfD/YdcC